MNNDDSADSVSELFASSGRTGFRARVIRPWIIFLFLTTLLILIAPLSYRGWRISQVPDIELPYDPQPILDLAVPDQDNAWVEFRKAAALTEPMDNATREDFSRASDEEWSSVPLSLLVWLEKNRSALEVWKRGTTKSDALYQSAKDFDPYSSEPHLPEEHRTVIRVAFIETMRLLDQGQDDDAWSLCRMQFHAANLVRRNGELSQGVMGITQTSLARRCAARWIQSPRLSIEQMTQALNELQNDLRPRPWLADAMRLYGIKLPAFDAAFHASPKSWVRPSIREPIHLTLFLNGEPIVNRRVQKMVIADFLKCCELPRRSRPQLAPLFFVMAPPPALYIQYYIDLSDREALHHELLITALAAEIFKRRHGDYPESLSQLVPEFLLEVPDNTFATLPTPIEYQRGTTSDVGAKLWAADSKRKDDRGLIMTLGKKSHEQN